MTPSEPFRIETPPPAPAISSCIRLPPRLLWMAFWGFGLVICAIKLMLGSGFANLVDLTACLFLLAALLNGAHYSNIRLFNGRRIDRPRCASDDRALPRICASPSGNRAGSIYRPIMLVLVLRTQNSGPHCGSA